MNYYTQKIGNYELCIPIKLVEAFEIRLKATERISEQMSDRAPKIQF